MIVDPNNRSQKPDSWYAFVLSMVIKYCEDLEDVDDVFPEFWQCMFEYWTEPFPIRQPKAYDLYGVQYLRSYIQF